jgi:hypothetical protein
VVGGEDSPGGIVGAVRRQLLRQLRSARQDDVHRQRSADDARRADQDVLGRDVQRLRRRRAHRLGVREAGGAGAGIGVAGIDDDRRRPAAILGESAAGEDDRRSDEPVLGEHGGRGDGAPVVGGDQRHVEPPPLDPGMAARGDEAPRRR